MKQLFAVTVVAIFSFVVGVTVTVFLSAQPSGPAPRSKTRLPDSTADLQPTPEIEPTANVSELTLAEFDDLTDQTAVTTAEFRADNQNIPDRLAAEQVILQYFPNLDSATLRGWTDAYESMPSPELHRLLQTKLQMPELIPSTSLLTDSTQESPESSAESTEGKFGTPHLPFMAARQNLMHWKTPGYRSNLLIGHLNSVNATEFPNGLTWNSFRNLEPGKVHHSFSPLHVAIEGRRQLMFRFEPGGILTRFGALERLDDGILGLRLASDEPLRLHGDFNVPADTVSLRTDEHGNLVAESRSDGDVELGPFLLTEITNPAQLRTENGVFFQSRDGEADSLKMISAESVKFGMLESSNVTADDHAVLQHLERISEFPAVRPK